MKHIYAHTQNNEIHTLVYDDSQIIAEKQDFETTQCLFPPLQLPMIRMLVGGKEIFSGFRTNTFGVESK